MFSKSLVLGGVIEIFGISDGEAALELIEIGNIEITESIKNKNWLVQKKLKDICKLQQIFLSKINKTNIN